MDEPPSLRLSQYPFVVVRIRCDECKRLGAYRLARLAQWLGAEADMDAVLARLTHDCPWRLASQERRRKYVPTCLAYLPDIHSQPRPPDLPPGLMKLRLVQGGKG